SVALQVGETIEQDHFRIDLEGVPVTGGAVPPQGLLVDDDPVHLGLLDIPYRQERLLINHRPALWVERSHEGTLSEAGIAFAAPVQVLAKCLMQMLYRRAGGFLRLPEPRAL